MEGLVSTIAEQALRERLNRVISNAEILWQKGLIHHPDFTMHGTVHSQKIDKFIEDLLEPLPAAQLNDREKFVLVASAYLHDLGMLFPLDSFIENEIRKKPNLRRFGRATRCESIVKDFCKGYGEEQNADEFFTGLEESPLPERMRIGEIIRQFHHLFSDHLIKRHGERLGLPRQAISMVATVSKGHRSVDLTNEEYDDTGWLGSTIRLGTLAALLRVADELDFSSERAPDILFEIFVEDLIRDPESLSHWIRHFCIRSVGPLQFSHKSGGLVEPIVHIVVDVPTEDYLTIIEEHAQKSISQVSTQDVKERLRPIGLCCPKVELRKNVDASTTPLPKTLQDRIGDMKISDFLRQQKENMVLEEEQALVREGFPANAIAKMVGYARKLYKVEYDCLNKLETKVTWEVSIRAAQEMSHIRHFYEQTDEPFKSISDLDFCNLTPERRITATRRFARAKTYREVDIAIDPPLTEGEEACYRFSEAYRNLIVYSKRRIRSKIEAGLWPFEDEVQGVGSTVRVPTEQLQILVLLPAGVEIEEPDFRIQPIDITLDVKSEEERLRQSSCLTIENSGGRTHLSLVVAEPLLMVVYWVVWAPKR